MQVDNVTTPNNAKPEMKKIRIYNRRFDSFANKLMIFNASHTRLWKLG